MHCAFNTFFHHTASHFVRVVDIPVVVIVVCVATARADELCKTVPALLSREEAGIFKLFANVRAKDPLADATHTEIVVADELMTRIKIPVGRYREILIPGSARRNALRKARSPFQIHVEMEEIKALAFGVSFQIRVTEIFIFLFNDGQMLVLDL